MGSAVKALPLQGRGVVSTLVGSKSGWRGVQAHPFHARIAAVLVLGPWMTVAPERESVRNCAVFTLT
jgi:hypothetical protein